MPMGKVTRKRKKILPFPGVSLIGYAAGLRKIRLKWRRLREGNVGGLNYDIQYRVKGELILIFICSVAADNFDFTK